MRYISLGRTQLFEDCGFQVDFSSLNSVGYVMKQLGNALYIAGETSEGVLYGVYDFCEQVLGMRFLTPEATYMEEMYTVPLYKTDRTEVPAFEGRDYMAKQSMQLKDFASRLKINSTYGEVRAQNGYGGVGSYYAGNGYTNLETLLPPKRGSGGRISEKNMQKHRAPRKNRRFFRGAPFENQIMVITIPCG